MGRPRPHHAPHVCAHITHVNVGMYMPHVHVALFYVPPCIWAPYCVTIPRTLGAFMAPRCKPRLKNAF